MLRNAAGPTVSGANHKPELSYQLLFPISCVRIFLGTVFCILTVFYVKGLLLSIYDAKP